MLLQLFAHFIHLSSTALCLHHPFDRHTSYTPSSSKLLLHSAQLLNPFLIKMYPLELPRRLSKTPKEITNPKTPKDPKLVEQFLDNEQVKTARKVSADATALFKAENAKEPSTPVKKVRIFSAKIDELDARRRLADCEAEQLCSAIDNLKRDRPDDDETVGHLLEQMRKRRRTSAEFANMSLALKSERATFLEGITDIDAQKRVELLESILLAPTKQARGEAEGRRAQNAWKQSLIEFYNAGNPETMSVKPSGTKYAHLWCPVSQAYLDSADVAAAHVAPKTLGAAAMSYLTGTHTDTVMLVGNGILLHKKIEIQLDRGAVALIPTSLVTDDTPIELKFVLIDESERQNQISVGGTTWGDIDGRILEFKNSARPLKRYLYLRYAMTMLYAWRHKTPGHEDLRANVWPSRVVWATPGKYVRKSSLHSIGGLIGEHFTETFDDDEDPAALSDVSQNLMAKFQAVVDEMSGNGGDDDDLDSLDDDE